MMWRVAGVVALLVAVYAWGYHTGSGSAQADVDHQAVVSWGERAVMAGKLADADRKLAEAQAAQADAHGRVVVKYVEVYRGNVKNPDVAKCVADSGLLDAYNASIRP